MKKRTSLLFLITPLIFIGVSVFFSCQESILSDSEDELITLKGGKMPTDVQQGDLYGDLWELERDFTSGVPIYYPLEYQAEIQDIVIIDTIDVVNPRLTESFTLEITCRKADGGIIYDDNGNPKSILYTITLDDDGFMKLTTEAPTPAVLYDLEGEIQAGVALYVFPVEEGRLNIIRSPSTVLSRRMTEVIKNFGDGTVAQVIRDYCGRLYMLRTDEALDLEYEDKPIDSPLENLAIYYELMTHGFNYNENENGLEFLVREERGFGYKSRIDSDWENGAMLYGNMADTDKKREFIANLAAACVASGSDKSNDITLDEIIFLNQFMGIPGGPSNELFDVIEKEVRMLDNMTKQVITKNRYYIDYSFFDYTRTKFDETLIDLWTISDENEDGIYEETEVMTGLSLGDMLSGDEPNTNSFLSSYGYTVFDEDLITTGAKGFANQANDYVQALELIHNNEEFLRWDMPTPTWGSEMSFNRVDSPFLFNYVEPDHSKKPERVK